MFSQGKKVRGIYTVEEAVSGIITGVFRAMAVKFIQYSYEGQSKSLSLNSNKVGGIRVNNR